MSNTRPTPPPSEIMICVSYASSTSSATSMHLKKAQERKNVKKIFAIEGGKKILILCVLFFLQSNFIQVSSQTFTVCPSEVPTARSTYDWCEEGKYKCVSSSNSGHYGCSFCTGGKYITEALSESSLQRGMGYFQHKSTSCLLCQDGKISASDFKACVDCDSGKVADATGENCITPCKINEYLNASECKACPILRYSQLGATAEADCKCAAGSYLNQNNVCKYCPGGWIKADAFADSCSKCPELHANTDYKGTSCTRCDNKTDYYFSPYYEYSTSEYLAFCMKCTFDRVAPNGGVGGDVCICPLGKYWRSEYSNYGCPNCDVGKYSNNDRTSCLACPAGTSDDGMQKTGQVSTGCNKCKAGQSSSEGSRCQECLPGTISLQDGDACTPCSQGTQYVDATTPCSICEAGTYREIVKFSTIQERTCASCPVGRHLLPSGTQKKEDHDNIMDCVTCPIGKEFVSSTECRLCDASSYQDENGVGSASCKKCPGGRQASSNGSTSADDCTGCVLGTIMSSPTPALQCSTCPSGQYRSTPSNQLGDACVICDAGYYIGNDATMPSLHDDKSDCVLCPKGYEFYNVTKCTVCASGRYKQIPNTEACVACSDNYFIADHRQESVAHDHANDCMACTHGRIAASGTAAFCEICQAGKEQVDNSCRGCVAGRFSTSLQLTCTDCPSGYYQDLPSLAYCLPCVPGESQHESGSLQCQACESGYFSSNTTAISCEKCTVGSSTGGRKGAARCEKCGSGTYGASCDKCKSGHYRGTGDPTEQCLECPSGFYQGDIGQASCLPCVPGTAASNVGSSNCTRCLVNYYANEIEQKVCKQCESGSFTNEKDGAAMCSFCMGGTYGDDCSSCSQGMYRTADDKTTSSCTSCPSGYYQEKVKQASCLPCIPGRHQPVTKQTSCKNCEINTYAEEAKLTACEECAVGKYAKREGSASCQSCEAGTFSSVKGEACGNCAKGKYRQSKESNGAGGFTEKSTDSTICVDCPAGWSSDEGSTKCQSCEPGKYKPENGNSCLSCPQGWKRSSNDVPASACQKCQEGQTTYDTSSSSCESCEIGKYQKDKMDCVNCEAGKYQDTKAQDKCKTCEQGLIPNKNSTACENPGWKVPKDCDFTTQYLNTSSSNPQDHKCAPCPLGASCENDVNWSGVRAKYGWWRVRSAEVGTGGISPPKCLVREEKNQQALPPCAFVRCPNPHACLGAKNPDKFKNEKLEDPATKDLNESCWYKGGYQTTTCGTNHSESCRLCGTCRVGFKRYGEGAKCMECPPSETNRAMLALGFLVMIVGSAILIYMTIKDEESGEKETSDAIKKIILNFLQMLSLAAGLPLQWTPAIETMFRTMATLSSAGTTLLVPDCELTHLKTSDAFYMKQIFFTFVIPIIVIICIISWLMIRLFCQCKLKIKRRDYKNYTILSIVLMTFLCYPMLSKIALSMLKCVLVGDQRYLMADLEEPCFEGRHARYVLLLTVPQILLVIVGLPILCFMILHRNTQQFHRYDFRMRYGLLYLGYRDGREWWEVIISFRKVLIVLIGTFGTILGVDLQSFLALFVIFGSIMIHLVGKPFDTSQPKFLLLHQLECAALTLAWMTFWGGMIFYLGNEQPDIVHHGVLVLMSVAIIMFNVIFLVFASYMFVKEFIKDAKKKAEVRRNSRVGLGLLQGKVKSTKIMPFSSENLLIAARDGEIQAPELILGPTAKRKGNMKAWDQGSGDHGDWGL